MFVSWVSFEYILTHKESESQKGKPFGSYSYYAGKSKECEWDMKMSHESDSHTKEMYESESHIKKLYESESHTKEMYESESHIQKGDVW